MATAPEKVTVDQANLALQQLAGVEPEPAEPETPEAPATAAVEEPPAPQEPEAAASTAETPEPVAESDDVQSLRKRLTDAEEKRKQDSERYAEQLRAIQERNQANARIQHDRYVRKSTAADKAYRTLKAVRTADGVPETEVDSVLRELESSVNPQSSSYVAPAAQQASEDQIVTLNEFLNEKGMTGAEAAEFGKWVQSEAATVLTPQEQAVAERSLDGFLRLAHLRWQSGLRETETLNQKKQADAAAAVKATQRIQRDAARAAASSTPSPKRAPASPKAIDYKKLSKDDVAELLRQSVLHAND